MKIYRLRILLLSLTLPVITVNSFPQSAWVSVSSGTLHTLNGITAVSRYDQQSGMVYRIFAAGDSGTLLVSENYGLSWTSIGDTSVTSDLTDVLFPYPDTGFVVGSGRTFYRLNRNPDGTYVPDHSPGPGTGEATFRSITGMPYVPVFFIAGDSGLIYRSYRMGRPGTWTRYSGFPMNLHDVCVVRSDAVYIVGDSATIIRGGVGGGYLAMYHPYNHRFQSYNSVAFYEDTGWVVGTGGSIAFTSNGGRKWIAQPSPVSSVLRCVFIDQTTSRSNLAWVVGDSGVILRTTDYGSTWSRQSSGTTLNLNGIRFTGSRYGVIIGENGTILQTSTGGISGPIMRLSADRMSFGNVIAGRVKTRIFTVANFGTSQLDIVSVISHNAKFTIAPSSASIPPSATQTFAVSYAPTVTGKDISQLSLITGDGFQDLDVSGVGVDSISTVGWVWRNPLPQGNSFFDVKFLTSASAIAIGDVGTIARSVDAGATWSILPYVCGVSAPLRAISFPNPDTGYIVGEMGTMLRTTDGGIQWNSPPNGIGDQAESVSFPDGLSGYVLTYSSGLFENLKYGAIYRTSDGGENWVNVYVRPGYSRMDAYADLPVRVYALDRNTVFAVGCRELGASSDSIQLIMRSGDGGMNWTSDQMDSPGSIYAIEFFDTTTGIAVGDSGAIYRTSNKGLTWSRITSGSTISLHDIAVSGPSHGIITGAGGVILTTDDAGQTWSLHSVGRTEGLYAVSMGGPANGIAVEIIASDYFSVGTIIRTTDGGNTWFEPGSEFTRNRLKRIRYSDSQHGILVGDGGSILQTQNGGKQWSPVFSGTLLQYAGVSFNDFFEPIPGRIFVVGDYGTLIFSPDNGSTWRQQWSGTREHLLGIWFTDSVTGCVVGTHGIILRTTDAGENWSDVSGSFTEDLQRVVFSDTSRGVVLSGEGTILRTGDGGLNWNVVMYGGGLFDVAMSNDTGMAVGNSRIIGTTDGGLTWRQKRYSPGENYTSVSMLDGMNALVTRSMGMILQTTDFGQSWFRQASGTELPLYSSAMIDPFTATVVGACGSILQTTTGGGRIGTLLAVENYCVTEEYALDQNYPNPFNPSTNIRFTIPAKAGAQLTVLKIYNLLGQEVAILVNTVKQPGTHSVSWNAAGLPSGMYFYRMTAGNFSEVMKMMVVK